MDAERQSKLDWMDLLWLLFLWGLAVLPPIREVHKQLILLAIGVLQLFEGQLHPFAARGRYYVVAAQDFSDHAAAQPHRRGEINSSYYPIFYVPVVTAAVYFGPWARCSGR